MANKLIYLILVSSIILLQTTNQQFPKINFGFKKKNQDKKDLPKASENENNEQQKQKILDKINQDHLNIENDLSLHEDAPQSKHQQSGQGNVAFQENEEQQHARTDEAQDLNAEKEIKLELVHQHQINQPELEKEEEYDDEFEDNQGKEVKIEADDERQAQSNVYARKPQQIQYQSQQQKHQTVEKIQLEGQAASENHQEPVINRETHHRVLDENIQIMDEQPQMNQEVQDQEINNKNNNNHDHSHHDHQDHSHDHHDHSHQHAQGHHHDPYVVLDHSHQPLSAQQQEQQQKHNHRHDVNEQILKITPKTLYNTQTVSPSNPFSIMEFISGITTLFDYQYRIEKFHKLSHKYTKFIREEYDIQEPFDKVIFSFVFTIIIYSIVCLSKQLLKNSLQKRQRYSFNQPDFSEIAVLNQTVKKIGIDVLDIYKQLGQKPIESNSSSSLMQNANDLIIKKFDEINKQIISMDQIKKVLDEQIQQSRAIDQSQQQKQDLITQLSLQLQNLELKLNIPIQPKQVDVIKKNENPIKQQIQQQPHIKTENIEQQKSSSQQVQPFMMTKQPQVKLNQANQSQNVKQVEDNKAKESMGEAQNQKAKQQDQDSNEQETRIKQQQKPKEEQSNPKQEQSNQNSQAIPTIGGQIQTSIPIQQNQPRMNSPFQPQRFGAPQMRPGVPGGHTMRPGGPQGMIRPQGQVPGGMRPFPMRQPLPQQQVQSTIQQQLPAQQLQSQEKITEQKQDLTVNAKKQEIEKKHLQRNKELTWNRNSVLVFLLYMIWNTLILFVVLPLILCMAFSQEQQRK
ncbi:UNKNOWN [Stylonychia lemnae]|uniref:Transmembrane protein n=1 Tax=Stylonychia lemnae TaxID=5949 RepID=A0A078AD81_STYLE|nr:UNKNOWN [Stylonychia lemnae]|eukprot:CDW79487.1 UNKNOWN [Stylonychia lemnae]